MYTPVFPPNRPNFLTLAYNGTRHASARNLRLGDNLTDLTFG